MSASHKLFQQGEVHWEGNPWGAFISNDLMRHIEECSPQKLRSFPVLGTAVLLCNTKKNPSNNLNLRKALSYAINRESLLAIAGRSNSTAYNFLPPSLSYKKLPQSDLSQEERESLARYYFELARQELSEKELEELTVIYPVGSKIFSYVVQEIQQQWKNVLDFFIPIVGTEYHNFLDRRRRGNYTMASGGWIAEYIHPLAFLSVLDSTKNKHASRWENLSYNHLIETLRASSGDPEVSIPLIEQAEMLINEEFPVIPLYHYGYTYAINQPVKNIYASPLGTLDLKCAVIDHESITEGVLR